jgi:phosphopantothenoylcysteine decarboxylase / phosphopantothenate---cysteine ligase
VRGERILLIVGAGIAAYKALELVRRGRDRGLSFRCVMTAGAKELVTPLSLATLSGDKVYTDLFSLTDEAEIGHIRLARDASLVVVAPATANLLARMASGHADDLATTVLLATDKPVLVAPAMNPFMWGHPATKRNVERLRADGVHFVGPAPGDMACGEEGSGRLAEPHEIVDAIERLLRPAALPLAGLSALVTSGPTYEPLDPVRFLGNRSSGRQGHAIAAALAEAGAAVTLVSGPVVIPDPRGVTVRHVGTAREMLAAVESALPADVAVFAAAVADWRPAAESAGKMKKEGSHSPPTIELVENPDVLCAVARRTDRRPGLVIGFAAETGNLEANAEAKLERKGCDWIVANDVSPGTGVFGGGRNRVLLLGRDGTREAWPELEKGELARRLVGRIAAALGRDGAAHG